ncbi:MAG: N-acetylmuramoyl-L-alanine amidase [Parcubacteria group bacterium]|nr:N-acetylmuramoyl-L-alanine amidase [Parcubacteria group bacterium]
MSFKQKYPIITRYLTNNTNRRSGLLISPGVKFVVAHDTGNPNSTAAGNVAYYERTANDANASAHIFTDDKEIIECIPALTSDKPEKAWQVLYNVSKDNELYGYDANDAAIGVEYCYGSNINAAESYKRYVWVLAYVCYKFKLNPATAVAGHFILDPARKTDPKSGLAASGRTYEQLLKDIVSEYNSSIITSNNLMKLIKNPSSQKIYAIGADNKKHWIFNEESFNVGKAMELWGDWNTIENVGDDSYAEGHTIILIK